MYIIRTYFGFTKSPAGSCRTHSGPSVTREQATRYTLEQAHAVQKHWASLNARHTARDYMQNFKIIEVGNEQPKKKPWLHTPEQILANKNNRYILGVRNSITHENYWWDGAWNCKHTALHLSSEQMQSIMRARLCNKRHTTGYFIIRKVA